MSNLVIVLMALVSFLAPMFLISAWQSGKCKSGLTVNNILFVVLLLFGGFISPQHLLLFAALFIVGTVLGTKYQM